MRCPSPPLELERVRPELYPNRVLVNLPGLALVVIAVVLVVALFHGFG